MSKATVVGSLVATEVTNLPELSGVRELLPAPSPQQAAVPAAHVSSVTLPPIKRSKRGCLTCLDRRIKCDEQQPSCKRCTHARRSCRYGSRLFCERTTKIKKSMKDQVDIIGSPIWDASPRSRLRHASKQHRWHPDALEALQTEVLKQENGMIHSPTDAQELQQQRDYQDHIAQHFSSTQTSSGSPELDVVEVHPETPRRRSNRPRVPRRTSSLHFDRLPTFLQAIVNVENT